MAQPGVELFYDLDLGLGASEDLLIHYDRFESVRDHGTTHGDGDERCA